MPNDNISTKDCGCVSDILIRLVPKGELSRDESWSLQRVLDAARLVPSLQARVKELEDIRISGKHLYELTLANQMRWMDEHTKKEKELTTLKQSVREALEKYGTHTPLCNHGDMTDCDCGFEQALQKLL